MAICTLSFRKSISQQSVAVGTYKKDLHSGQVRQGSVRLALSISELSVQPRIQPESRFALRYSLRESVVHCWRRRAKLRSRPVTQRTEALLCEGLLRDSLPLHAVVSVFPGIRWISCMSLFHSCTEDSPEMNPAFSEEPTTREAFFCRTAGKIWFTAFL